MILSLIGYRGCGKTVVAQELGRRLDWPAVDADQLIEEQAGLSIREIFSTQGEAAFRARERQVISQLLTRDRLVLATGGGAILDAGTRVALRQAGPVVWLQAPVDVLRSRIAADLSSSHRRPSLTGLPPADEITALLAVREPLYAACATLVIDTALLTLEEVTDKVLAGLALPPVTGRSP